MPSGRRSIAIVLFSDEETFSMQSFPCQCGATLFFGNTVCVSCQRQAAVCPACRNVVSTQPIDRPSHDAASGPDEQSLQCSGCGATFRMCQNAIDHAVCSRGVDDQANTRLCRYCELNELIPDLSVPGNLEKWRCLESAKHRALFSIDRLNFPITTQPNALLGNGPVLRFQFKSATSAPVVTGHVNGMITVDIAEADSIWREQTRVALNEPQRTVVGHFRHEMGHYFWERLVLPDENQLAGFRDLFGDERQPNYETARAYYYTNGPQRGWNKRFISAYASMHPWEDFAESFGAYLDMFAVLNTTQHFQSITPPTSGTSSGVRAYQGDQGNENLDAMLEDYRKIGIVANEINRDIGLPDLVPEVLTDTVVSKLHFIHQLR